MSEEQDYQDALRQQQLDEYQQWLENDKDYLEWLDALDHKTKRTLNGLQITPEEPQLNPTERKTA